MTRFACSTLLDLAAGWTPAQWREGLDERSASRPTANGTGLMGLAHPGRPRPRGVALEAPEGLTQTPPRPRPPRESCAHPASLNFTFSKLQTL